jgi:2-keto-3-deoxy-L-rhamnonate aldolase RhmA
MRLRSVPTEPTAVRIRQLAAQAGRAGYMLERASRAPYDWMLIDAEDGANTYSAPDLDQVEQWLNE